MPERGGPTTWSGIAFQARATVYQLVRLLCDRALSDDPVVNVQCEATHPVDDVVITKQSGGRVFQTVKEQIDRTPSETGPWCKMWRAILQQYRDSAFESSRDIIEIVFPTKGPLAETIEELQKRSLAAATLEDLLKRLSTDQRAMFNQIVKLVDAAGDDVLGVLKVVRVSFLGDEARLHEHLMAQLHGVTFLDRVVSEAVINALIKLVLDKAETRAQFDFETLITCIAQRGVDLQDPLRMSFKILSQEMPGEPTPEDAQLFFRGFPATWPVIVGRVPVERDCLAKAKEVVLPEATECDTKKGLKVHVIIGPQGVGKVTLAKQLAVALAQQGFLVGWHDGYPPHPSKSLASDIIKVCRHGHRLHLFSRMSMVDSLDSVLHDLARLISAIPEKSRLSLYLIADSNHFQMLADGLGEAVHVPPNRITIPLNLADDEIDRLVIQLERWDALGRLSGKSLQQARAIFMSKSRKILLAALIEAIDGNERENIHNIIAREFRQLPEHVRLAYPLVALPHAYGIEVPSSLFHKACNVLELDTNALSLSRELHGVLLFKSGRLATRHPQIARTLCEALSDDNSAGFSAHAEMWLSVVSALLRTVDECDQQQLAFVKDFAEVKAVAILNEELETFGETLLSGAWRNLSPGSRGVLANSVARSYQGRGDLGRAVYWANKSRDEIWQQSGNNAEVILAYCQLSAHNWNSAAELANRMIAQTTSPLTLFHGIRILCRTGEVGPAREILNKYKQSLRLVPGLGDVCAEVHRADVGHQELPSNEDPWEQAAWVAKRLDLGQIPAGEAMKILRRIIDENVFVHSAFTNLCHLLFVEKQFVDVAEICDQMLDRIMSVDVAAATSTREQKKVNIAETKSMVLATKAWALHCQHGEAVADAVENLFSESRMLKDKNAWACNWYGWFLFIVKKDIIRAEAEFRKAIRINSKVPPFYRNLARLLHETMTIFSRDRNRDVITNCKLALGLCPPGSYWNWGGISEEVESILYVAESLDQQRVRDGTRLTA